MLIVQSHRCAARRRTARRRLGPTLDVRYFDRAARSTPTSSSEMLPALAQHHFRPPATASTISSPSSSAAADAGLPLRAAFAPAPDAKADANAELFQVRLQDFEPLVAEVGRFATFTALPRDGHRALTHTIIGRPSARPEGRTGSADHRRSSSERRRAAVDQRSTDAGQAAGRQRRSATAPQRRCCTPRGGCS